jgi:nickel-dependent lactate racemase
VIVKLGYGAETRAVDLRGLRVRALRPAGHRGSAAPVALAGRALDRPLAGDALANIASRRSSAVVVVPDGTRACALPSVLAAVLERLRLGGIAEQRVTVVVACGTHPAEAEEALRERLGPVTEAATVVQHDARDEAALAVAGRLEDGLEVRLRREVLEADLLVTVGAVRHHYFAGFGGGPKMVFPGVAGYREIQRNHSLVLDLDRSPPRRAPGCEPGVLAGNPVAEQIARAAALRPPDLALCLVPGVDGGIADAFAGPWERAWEAAIAGVRAAFEVDPERFDLVVASGGGAPADETVIQAHKGLDAACRFLRPGGELLYVAAMSKGPGSADMAPFLADPSPEAIVERLAARWVQYGHTTLRIVERTGRHRVHLVSELDPALAAELGFDLRTDADEVVDAWRERYPAATVGVLPGPAVYPRQGS